MFSTLHSYVDIALMKIVGEIYIKIVFFSFLQISRQVLIKVRLLLDLHKLSQLKFQI